MKKIFLLLVILSPFCFKSQNNSLHFDGTNDKVQFSYNPATNYGNSSPFSIEMWVKTTSFTSELFSNIFQSVPPTGIVTGLLAGQPYFYIGNSLQNGIYVVAGNSVNDNNWHHLAFVYDGSSNASNVRIYIDGVNQSTSISFNNLTLPAASGSHYCLGARNDDTYFYGGNIDELRVWSKALCAAEINGRKNCELAGNEYLLAAYYKFNQGTASQNNSAITSIADNKQGGSSNGTLLNFALTGNTSNWVTSTPLISATTCTYGQVNFSGLTTICKGSSTSISLSGASTYTWNFGSNSSTALLSPTITTSYTVTSTSPSNCDGGAIITISVNPTPVVQVAPSRMEICIGETIVLSASGAITYTWSNNSNFNTISSAINNTLTTFTVSGSNAFGCINSKTIAVTALKCTGISQNPTNEFGLEIGPNPVLTVVHINNLPVNCKVFIYNQLGQTMYSEKSETLGLDIDMSEYNTGIYTFSVKTEDGFIYTKKIIRQ